MKPEPTPRSTDPIPDLEAHRLFVSAALTTHTVRSLGGRVAVDGNAKDLLALARRLGQEAGPLEHRYRLRFEPSYPGLTAGVEGAGGSLRLVLACTVRNLEEQPLGVVFTTLIPGRLPQVSVAPVEAHVPDEWRPLGDRL